MMSEYDDIELVKEERQHWLARVDHPNRLLRRVAKARLSRCNQALVKLNHQKREQAGQA